MKHITFDQSSVLREFARIAHEKGFIKEAAGPMDAFEGMFDPETMKGMEGKPVDLSGITPTAPSPSKTVMPRGEIGTGQGTSQSIPTVGPPTNTGGKPSISLVQNPMFTNLAKELATGYAAQAQTSEQAAKAYLDKSLQTLKTNLTGKVLPKDLDNFINYMMQSIPQHGGPAAKTSMVNEDGLVTNAKDDASKLYDITDETGEQLVEKAHPGGGTRTELTHSKTDENLVETIVEQQKKDLEVAKSVPKGTYAALADLYMSLHKMGHKDKLGGLKKLIKSVATIEDVVEYTLVRLADRLDTLGNKTAANKVDELIKKKA